MTEDFKYKLLDLKDNLMPVLGAIGLMVGGLMALLLIWFYASKKEDEPATTFMDKFFTNGWVRTSTWIILIMAALAYLSVEYFVFIGVFPWLGNTLSSRYIGIMFFNIAGIMTIAACISLAYAALLLCVNKKN
jgi:hypothetical protein